MQTKLVAYFSYSFVCYKGLFKMLKSKVKIPVFVMIRPRGGDFLYSDEEFDVMKMEIEIFKEHGADGFVFGILTK